MSEDKFFVWTPSDIARELGLKKSSVFQKLKNAELTGGSGEYSTKQVLEAFYGNLTQERIRLTRAQAEKAELEAAQLGGQLVPLAVAKNINQTVVMCVRSALAGRMSREEIDNDVIALIHSQLATLGQSWIEGFFDAEYTTDAKKRAKTDAKAARWLRKSRARAELHVNPNDEKLTSEVEKWTDTFNKNQ
jgi:hypothetical protein